MTSSALSPLQRSSLVTTAADAQETSWQGQRVVTRYSSATTPEIEQARQLSLCDLSVLDRFGFKGRGSLQWLTDQEVIVPEAVNRAHRQAHDGLTVRLSYDEYLLLTNPWVDSQCMQSFRGNHAVMPGVYSVPRQHSHAWIFISGARAPKLMSHVCGVDLRTDVFPFHHVAQTTVATLNTIVIAERIGSLGGFHLLCDQTAADWFWQALLDAMSIYGGRPVGLSALSHLAAQTQ